MTQVAKALTLEAVISGAKSSGDLEIYRQAFAHNGYLIFKNVVPKQELVELKAKILARFEEVKRAGELFAGGGTITGHLNCFPGEGARRICHILEDRGIIEITRALFPKAVGAPNVGCNLNLPRSTAQHYHVDGLFCGEFAIANVAMVNTDLVNGAIDVLPGTHRRFYKYWQFVVEGLHRGSTRLPMQQGDVLLRTSNMWHRGMPNHSDMARPMLAFTWEDGGNPPDVDPFAQHGGEVALLPNWYRTHAMGRLRERTFAAAPFTYDAYRFVTSLYGNKGYSSW